MRLWLDPGTARGPPDHGRRRGQRAARAERAGGGGKHRRSARAREARPIRSASAPPAGSRKRASSRTSSSKPARRARSSGSRTSRGRSLAPRPTSRSSAFRASTPSASASFSCPTANALDVEAAVIAELARLAERFPPGVRVPRRLQHDDRRPRVDPRGPEDACRSHRARRARACSSFFRAGAARSSRRLRFPSRSSGRSRS